MVIEREQGGSLCILDEETVPKSRNNYLERRKEMLRKEMMGDIRGQFRFCMENAGIYGFWWEKVNF